MPTTLVDRLKAAQGAPFWMELTPVTLELLMHAGKLDAPDIATLLGRSNSLVAQLLSGQTGFVDGVVEKLERYLCFWALQTRQPNARPLVQFTGRSLELVRKGRGYKVRGLAADVDISEKYLHQLESGKRREPSTEMRERLSEHLGVQFFLL